MINMKYQLLIFLLLSGCASPRKYNFTKNSYERFINLIYDESHEPKIILLTKANDEIKVKVSDAIGLFDESLQKEQFYGNKKELEKAIQVLKTIKKDTIIHETKIGSLTLQSKLESWVPHGLLLKGKAEVLLKGSERIKQIRYVFHEDLLGGESGTFYDMNNRHFFYHIIALGE